MKKIIKQCAWTLLGEKNIRIGCPQNVESEESWARDISRMAGRDDLVGQVSSIRQPYGHDFFRELISTSHSPDSEGHIPVTLRTQHINN